MNPCMNQPPLYGYVFFYQAQRLELHAASLYDARQQALAKFKPPKSRAHLVHGMLAARPDGQPVVHSPDF